MQILKMTVVPGDRFISINGEGYHAEEITIASDRPQYGTVHALQWFGAHGQIEYATGPAVGFADAAMLTPYIRPWQRARAKTLRARHAAAVAAYEQATARLADQGEHIAQLDAQISALKLELAGANAATRGATESAKTRLVSTVARMRSELAELEKSEPQMQERIVAAGTAAAQAEADLS